MDSKWENNVEKELIKYSELSIRGTNFSIDFTGKTGDKLCNLGTQVIGNENVALESLCW